MSEKTRPESWLSKIAIDCFDQISTTNNKVKSTACSPHGLYPVIDQGQNYISGYINDESKLIKITTPICIFGDHTRIIKWVEHNFVPGADGTKLLKPKDFIYPRYAYYSLCALNIPDKGYSRHFKYFKELKIDIPAWEEQKIIAEKLDTLLAQVDSTKARLEQIPQILKRFRQAVLAAAVSGKLTNISPINYFNISQIAQVIGGLTKNSKRNNFELQVPYLRVANVYENELRLEDISKIGVQQKELDRVSLEYEDLLIVEGNGSLDQIGRAALWRDEIKECVHQNHLIKVRANREKISPRFLLFYLMSAQGKAEIINRATSGAGLYTLSISKISSIMVPLYSLYEQAEIVRRVEQLFAYADTIEKQVNNALARVNNLTQSILAKAFRGELTAQWRAENPDLISGENSAAALLEKIKAERAASRGKKASRKKS
ncbi:restriction endonuclease subunit S [Escherichia albertii]|uniref:restriction endonuclease subunit S n=1 Tax=Escherichia albertii TaxID=208962 RepID=UPI000743EF1A|nr:restriction endonuclease subunit S [Escherichia albertii]EJI9012205.1 restriction endonuclease subunit S [Escherichia albertii]EJQ6146960.1 restriction endonuclease subunit S [Escherichia albertii]MCE7711206.1 restriction endonuclease subunit S [Escherichia albertii]MCQ8911072.1 restriction endonuclease subunit S [Escherichia albertii]MCQ8919961.1 restriction endonuclease subunit S [Escherichia albertii]